MRSIAAVGADPAGQDVGPVLRAVQAHRLVVRVEDDTVAGDDLIGAERHHHAAGSGAAAEGGDDELAGAADDLPADVVDGVDVAPRLHRRGRRSVDDVEVDAVGEHVAAADHQHLGVLGDGVAQGRRQSAALTGRHGPVVEVELSTPTSPSRRYPISRRPRHVGRDVARLVERLQHVGHAAEAAGQGHRGRQLHAVVDDADLADPDAAVAGVDEHGVMVATGDRAGLTGQHRPGMGVEHSERDVAERRAHARGSVGGPDPAHDRGRVVGPREVAIRGRIAGRSVPITSGRPSSNGSGSNAASAAFSTTSPISSIAASATGPL